VEWIGAKSATTQDWTPEQQDTDTSIDYLTEAHSARTCTGIDQITPDTFIFAHKGIRQAIMRILHIIARTAKTPTAWGRLRIVLALKPGRNPQDIKKGYRPIGVGSLLLKAIERVIKRQFDIALERKPLHKSILAYQKTIGHEMAVFAIKGTILHEKYRDPKARIVGIGIDIEHAFNGTWKELVLRQAKSEHEIQNTIWNISRHMMDTVTYQVDVHGHLTEEQTQETGVAQGPSMSPTYFNISMSPLLKELDDGTGTIGIQVGDRLILGVA
jgi:hypothetical protein